MLTDTAGRNAKPREKPYKLTDGGGLYVIVNPNGSRWWSFQYRVQAREKLISLRAYPEISLREARERRDGAKSSQERRRSERAAAD
jgi:Arm domain-containing DNA-binding protein